MSFIKVIEAEVEKVWAAITAELRKAVPESIIIVNVFSEIVGSPVLDKVIEVVSLGKISIATITLLNTILKDLLKGLYQAEIVDTLTASGALAHYAGVFATLTDMQRSALYTQLATEIVKVTGGSITVMEDELKTVMTWYYLNHPSLQS